MPSRPVSAGRSIGKGQLRHAEALQLYRLKRRERHSTPVFLPATDACPQSWMQHICIPRTPKRLYSTPQVSREPQTGRSGRKGHHGELPQASLRRMPADPGLPGPCRSQGSHGGPCFRGWLKPCSHDRGRGRCFDSGSLRCADQRQYRTLLLGRRRIAAGFTRSLG